jgi:hypothetical protein
MSPRTSGHALVITSDQDSVNADVEIVDNWVHLTGVRRYYGQGEHRWFRPRPDKAVSRGQVREIRWLS